MMGGCTFWFESKGRSIYRVLVHVRACFLRLSGCKALVDVLVFWVQDSRGPPTPCKTASPAPSVPSTVGTEHQWLPAAPCHAQVAQLLVPGGGLSGVRRVLPLGSAAGRSPASWCFRPVVFHPCVHVLVRHQLGPGSG